MQKQRPRMIDVARAAGVSRTTASFVLSGKDVGISVETQERVRDVAAQLGFQRNATAVALATGRTRRLGVVPSDPRDFLATDLYTSAILAGITRGALDLSYDLLLHAGSHEDWHDLRDRILAGPADAFLLVARRPGDPLTAALLESDAAVVCINFSVDHPRCVSVDCDNEGGAFEAVSHLLNLGHREIAVVYPGMDFSWGRERLEGARRAFQAAGQPMEDLHPVIYPDLEVGWEEWIETALRKLDFLPKVTAIFCCDDMRACAIMAAARGKGIRVPEELSIVGFNGTIDGANANPPLTSVYQDLTVVGMEAVKAAVRLIETGQRRRTTSRVPTRLIVRGSTGPPSSGSPQW